MGTDDDGYYVLLVKRQRIAGTLYVPGVVLHVDSSRLRVAANIVRTGAGRPFDARTRRDVELFLELQRVLPTA